MLRNQTTGPDRNAYAAVQEPSFEELSDTRGQAEVRLSLPVGNLFGHEAAETSVAALLTAQGERLEDLAPQAGDLVAFPFRLLSAAYLGAGGYHLDFSGEGVLKRALPVFQEPEAGTSVRTDPLVVVRDHSFNIEDRIGVVKNARWRPADLDQGLPAAGIEADLYINWKLAGDVVRRLMHEPPLLDSCSVSLGFNWEKSHPQLKDGAFWDQLGQEADGEAVRIIVTDILSVEHVGLVFAGADASARRTAGDTADAQDPLIAEGIMSASLSAGEALAPNSPLWNLFGVTAPDMGGLEARARETVALSALGQEAREALRREVRALLVQLDGAQETDLCGALAEVVRQADWATLEILKREYARRLEAVLPVRCHSCGSEQVSRRSSRPGMPGNNRRRELAPGQYQ